ncbi:hypothetical protein LTR91_011415 [Friedmanniomyces endolithicus]|uniref:Peptidase M61 catalytic domain-containing protein n=1 Tax=Friedmanniomyces endolithicus TaxID=329885 RepID=A0AAN6J4E1_9PEZI|nr:hypothetical protein LTR35_016402 [Friedmanniomyces endolithicus]KAK0274558.1 hypothetical protein LTS00_015376 [Friedmanniomyces endolithicus]KAK0303747.1 hypothetical protein LTR01_007833 [Friedmanniomyces endolithicus]KAK0313987.1 hypothetical protein LTR82_013297 [Friedmanniomyces endolithicus]KAK0829492.1 hypothetical protein LTR73_004436 [Friedmanniomyces endolithicus]
MLLKATLLPFISQAASSSVITGAQQMQQLLQAALPSIGVTLTPVVDATASSSSAVLDISLSFSPPDLPANASLVELPLVIGNVPCQTYNKTSAIVAVDDDGILDLTIATDEALNIRRWLTSRSTVGAVRLSMTALPREIDITTPMGPRIDLREIDGGLLGSASSMVPLPAAPPHQSYNITVCWDLSKAPANTSYASSLGEDRCTEIADKAQTIQALRSSIFAVGPTLHRYPPSSQSPEMSQFGLFYFGDRVHIPFDVTKLADYVHALFVNVCGFFHDSDIRPYRVFLRSSLRGFGGQGFLSSFMLEYFARVEVEQWELEWLLAHEATHNWPLMDSTPGQVSGADNTWYNEGIATYYQLLLPYRFGKTSKVEFVKQLNLNLQAYFTNPTINMSNEEVAEQTWQNSAAQRLPYHRGLLYFLQLEDVLRQSSGGKLGIRSTVLQLLDRKRKGEAFDLDCWISLAGTAIGSITIAKEQNHAMAAGGFLGLPSSALSHFDLRVVVTAQERLELGFDTAPLNSRVISGMIFGSRADEAGIQDGDTIVQTRSMYWQVADNISRNMRLRLTRDGIAFDVSYWPRSREKVPSLQVEDAGFLHGQML